MNTRAPDRANKENAEKNLIHTNWRLYTGDYTHKLEIFLRPAIAKSKGRCRR